MPPSLVNNEVKLYNKRLQSLMSTFNYIRLLKMSTGRRHHTKYGLDLDKKGKDSIVSNLVREIRNLYLPCKIYIST